MFDFLKKKKVAPQVPEHPAPTAPLLFTVRITPVGTQYNCHKSPRSQRPLLIKNLKPLEEVYFEPGTFEGEKLYYVLNRLDLDLCVLPAPFRRYVEDMVKKPQLIGTVEQNDPLVINVSVHGEYKKKWDLYDGEPMKKEYTYGIKPQDEYLRIPANEIPCELTPAGDAFAVSAAGMLVGTTYPKRTENLKEMLEKHECVTTVYLMPNNYDGRLRMVLRF